MGGNGNGGKIPGWAIGFVIAALIGIGISRADVGNLKERVSTLEELPQAVAKIGADVDGLKTQQSEMRQDIKTLLQRVR